MRIRPLPPLSALGLPAWLGTLAAFALLCGVTAWWAVQLLAPRAPVAPATGMSAPAALPELKLAAQLFGAAPLAQDAGAAGPSNIEVIGVLAAGVRGSAILAVDGQPPRAYAVGERISPVQTLAAVRADAVVVNDDQSSREIAAPARPSLSVLTDGPGRGADAQAAFGGPADSGPRIAAPLGGGSGDGPLPPRPVVARPAPAVPTPAVPPSIGPGSLRPGGVAIPGIVPVHPQPQPGGRGD